MDTSEFTIRLNRLCDTFFPTDPEKFDEEIGDFLSRYDELISELLLSRKSNQKKRSDKADKLNQAQRTNILKNWLRNRFPNAGDPYLAFKAAWERFEQQKKTFAARLPLVISKEDFIATAEFQRMADRALEHFSKKSEYTREEALAWLIFSAILWDGIKDRELLHALLCAIKKRVDMGGDDYYNEKPISLLTPFIHHNTVVTLDYKSKKMLGYQRISNSRGHGRSLVQTAHQVVLGNFTRIWLLKLCQLGGPLQIPDERDLHTCLEPIVSIINDSRKQSKATMDFLRKRGLFFLQCRPGVEMPIAMTAVCTSTRTQMVGLRENSWKNITELGRDDLGSLDERDMPDVWFKKNMESGNSRMSPCRHDDVVAIREIINNVKIGESKSANKNAPDLVALRDALESGKLKLTGIGTLLAEWYCTQSDIQYRTRLNYFGQISHLARLCDPNPDFSTWTMDDFLELYRRLGEHAQRADILSFEDDKLKVLPILKLAVTSFHNFLDERFPHQDRTLIDDIDLTEIFVSDALTIVSSNAISPAAYKLLLERIQHDLPFDSVRVRIFLILAYRTGMRPGEIFSLTLDDFSELNTDEPIITRYSKGKTLSARRRVLLAGLLKPAELTFIKKELSKISPLVSNRNIFVRTGFKELHYSHLILLEALTDLMRRVLPLYDDRITIYTLRHAAISNIMLALGGHPDLVAALTDYTQDDVARMRRALLGNLAGPQERFNAGAGQVGHLEPGTSFAHYHAYGWLDFTYALTQAQEEVPVKAIQNITGWSAVKISKLGKGAPNGMVRLNQLSQALSQKLHPTPKNRAPKVSLGANQPLEMNQSVDDLNLFDDALPPAMFTQFDLGAYDNWLRFVEHHAQDHSHDDSIGELIAKIHSDSCVKIHHISRKVRLELKERKREDENLNMTDPMIINTAHVRQMVNNLLNPHINAKSNRQSTNIVKYGKVFSETRPLKLDEQTEKIFAHIMRRLSKMRWQMPQMYGFLALQLINKIHYRRRHFETKQLNPWELLYLSEILAKLMPDDCILELTLIPVFICKQRTTQRYNERKQAAKGKRKIIKQTVYSKESTDYLKSFPNIKVAVDKNATHHKLQLLVGDKNRFDIIYHLSIIILTLDIHLPQDAIMRSTASDRDDED